MISNLNGKTGERDVLLGNEDIVRGTTEACIKVAAAYPVIPSSYLNNPPERVTNVRFKKVYREE